MKQRHRTLLVFSFSFVFLILAFWLAYVEAKEDEYRLNKMDSLINVMTSPCDSTKKWKDIATLNHLTIERLNNSVRDLQREIDSLRTKQNK